MTLPAAGLGSTFQNVPFRKSHRLWVKTGGYNPEALEAWAPARPEERCLTCTAQQVPAAQGPVLSGSKKVLRARQPPEAEVPEDHRSESVQPWARPLSRAPETTLFSSSSCRNSDEAAQKEGLLGCAAALEKQV